MKKKVIYFIAILVVSAVAAFNAKTVLEANHNYDLAMVSIDALSENGSDGESSDIKELYKKNHINNVLDCTIKESYQCKVGITIPAWVPKVGGLRCEFTYIDEVEYPGKINSCIFTGNPNSACDYYQCKKNT